VLYRGVIFSILRDPQPPLTSSHCRSQSPLILYPLTKQDDPLRLHKSRLISKSFSISFPVPSAWTKTTDSSSIRYSRSLFSSSKAAPPKILSHTLFQDRISPADEPPVHGGPTVSELVTLTADLTPLGEKELEKTIRVRRDGEKEYFIEFAIGVETLEEGTEFSLVILGELCFLFLYVGVCEGELTGNRAEIWKDGCKGPLMAGVEDGPKFCSLIGRHSDNQWLLLEREVTVVLRCCLCR